MPKLELTSLSFFLIVTLQFALCGIVFIFWIVLFGNLMYYFSSVTVWFCSTLFQKKIYWLITMNCYIFWDHCNANLAEAKINRWQQTRCFTLFQGLDDPVMKSTAVDIFSYVVEFNPSMVRDFILHEGQKQDDVRGFNAVMIRFWIISLLCLFTTVLFDVLENWIWRLNMKLFARFVLLVFCFVIWEICLFKILLPNIYSGQTQASHSTCYLIPISCGQNTGSDRSYLIIFLCV